MTVALDLYVANDLDPNRLYLNVPARGGLGFRLEERGAALGVADRNAGMGIAAADASGDGRPDLFVTNSHRQLHGVFRSRGAGADFADARPDFAQAFDTTLAGWGASWADLDLDGHLDLVFANGAIPVTNLDADAEPIKVLGSVDGEIADVSAGVGLGDGPFVNGRGLAAADYDNDGDLDVAVASIAGELVLLRNSGAVRTLARGAAGRLFAGNEGHGDPPEWSPACQGGAGGGQLPVLRGSAHPLRPGHRDQGPSAGRALFWRRCDPSPRCRGRSPRNHFKMNDLDGAAPA